MDLLIYQKNNCYICTNNNRFVINCIHNVNIFLLLPSLCMKNTLKCVQAIKSYRCNYHLVISKQERKMESFDVSLEQFFYSFLSLFSLPCSSMLWNSYENLQSTVSNSLPLINLINIDTSLSSQPMSCSLEEIVPFNPLFENIEINFSDWKLPCLQNWQ